MPYRRLPNTDQARIRAMEKLLEKVGMISVSEMAVSLNTISKIRGLLNRFRRLSEYYKACFDNQSKASRKHQENSKLARLYISHFIQVLNLAALRMEIKPAQKNYYGLQPNVNNVPDLISETALMEWGEKIIVGEMKRTSEGGIPIYNPTIAKVKVRYDIFVESNERQKNLQRLTAESLEDVTLMRPQVDELILDAWNQIEDYYKDVPDVDKRLDLCREYGIVYYYRTGEKKD